MQKGFTPVLVLIGVLVIIAVAGGAYYVGKSQISAVSSPSLQPVPLQNPTGGTTDWKTYQDTKTGFSFKYPSNAQASTEAVFSMLSLQEDDGINVKPPYEAPYNKWYTMDLVVRGNPQGIDAKTIINNYIEDIKKTCSPPACGTPAMIQNTLKPYQNGVINGYIFHIGAETDSVMVVQVKGNKAYIFRMSGDQGYVTDSGLKIFDQILSSFKFTQ